MPHHTKESQYYIVLNFIIKLTKSESICLMLKVTKRNAYCEYWITDTTNNVLKSFVNALNKNIPD